MYSGERLPYFDHVSINHPRNHKGNLKAPLFSMLKTHKIETLDIEWKHLETYRMTIKCESSFAKH